MRKIILGIIMAFGAIIFISQNTSAVSVGTAGFDLNYASWANNAPYNWQWRGGLAYNTKTAVNYVRAYQFTTPNITPTGNFATVHFETTMVFQSNSWDRLNFDNLGNLSITACNSSLGHALSIKAQSVSYAITPWVDGTVTKSLTVYGDISLGNIKKQQQQIVCAISTDNYFFYTAGATGASQWFESNPMSWNFTDDQTEALLQEQIIQNQYMIQQNHTQIEATYENTRAIYNQNQWLQDSTPPNVDTSSLGSSAGWMPPGPVDSILTLPLQLLQGIVNVFTNTNCSPLQVPVPYVNEEITLPCVSTLMDDIGFTPVWNIVGGVISAVIIWDTLKWLYRFVDDTLTFRENNSGMWGGL